MDTNPRVEPLPRFERYRDDPEEPWHRSPRARLFGLVAGLTLVAGVIYTLLQPLVYRSSATVLMSAPSAIDAEVAAADIQGVAIQSSIWFLITAVGIAAMDGSIISWTRTQQVVGVVVAVALCWLIATTRAAEAG